jgi:hypothetical protein
MSTELPNVSAPTFSGSATHEGAELRVRFAGTADLESRDELIEVVEKTGDLAVKLEVERVVVDFRELDFMNSSSFKVFVTWLARIKDLDPERQYKIHILSNPDFHWQRRSLAALSCFAIDLVSIET